MKLNRTDNSIKGISSGVLNKIVTLILPFFVNMVFINKLGVEYLGLNSLFTSILNILNLAELGVGSAISYSMYSPIAKNDKVQICELLNLYKKLYRYIGIFVLGAGLLLLPFLNHLFSSDVPNNVNIYIVFILYLLNTSFSYFLFSYKNSLFTAHQMTYVTNNINSLIKILLNIFQLFSLIIFSNYYLFVILLFLSTIINNIIVQIYSKKYFPSYSPNGVINSTQKKGIYSKVKALFLYKVGSIVLTSVDSVVINYFLGLTILGKYNSYYFIINALFGFLQVITSSMLAGIGNSVETETVEKNFRDFKRLSSFQGWIICICTVCLLCLYQNFIQIWIGKDNMLSLGVVVLLSIDFYVWKMMEIINLYRDAAGLWEFDKYRPLVASLVNLVLNILLIKIIGLYGVVLSTILSIVLIILPWSSYILFKKYFKGFYNYFIKYYIKNFIITAIICGITFMITLIQGNNTLINLLIRLITCLVLSNLLYFSFYSRDEDFNSFIYWLLDKLKINRFKSIIKKTINLLKIFVYFVIAFILIIIVVFFVDINESKKNISNIKYVHFSIDDTIDIFKDISNNEDNYNSIFDNSTLKYLKKLHDNYDAKFSLFVFYDYSGFNLDDCTFKFKNEFIENSDWLRFGFHSYSSTSDYSKDLNFYKDYNKTVEQLKLIVGEESITYTIRTDKFKMSIDNLANANKNGIMLTGLLSADSSSRNSYYLSEKENQQLFLDDYYFDEKNNLKFYNTDIRIENVNLLFVSKENLQDDILVVFTHEWALSDYNMMKMEILCKLISYNQNIEYTFLS